MLKNLTIVIVLYNSEDIIEKCLIYLKKNRLIILDNSKNNNLKKKLLNKYNNIEKYIIPKTNLGFSGGNNFAATHVKTDFIYFLSPDVFLYNNKLDLLINEFKINPRLGIITPSLVDLNLIPLKNKSFFPEIKFLKKFQNNNYWIWGASMMIKKSIFVKCGGFDESFFIYYSDVDICKKIKLMNYEIKELNTFSAIHIGSASSKLSFFEKSVIQISHKFSYYLYLKKYNYITGSKLIIDFFDFFQRIFFNFITLNFKKSYKNFLRIVAIFKYLICSKHYF